MIMGDWWENFETRELPEVMRALRREELRNRACSLELHVGPIHYGCTRPPGHDGRHVGCAHTLIAAAWPGSLPPTLEDLL